MKKDENFRLAEAHGKIKPMPEVSQTHDTIKMPELPVVGNPELLDNFIGQAKMAHQDYLEVTPELMKYLMNSQKGDSMTYKGIELFVEGSRSRIMKERRMTAEEFGTYMGRKISEEIMRKELADSTQA